MPALCNVNGRILPESEAAVPVLDRGFLFGDSVYEVIRTRDGGVPFAWPEHLERLRASATGLAMELDLSDTQIMRRVKETSAAAGLDEAYIRIIATRGTGTAPNIDLACAPGPCTWVVFVRPLPDAAAAPARLALVDRRRNHRRALDPAVKSGNYLNNVLGLAEAKAAGATDCAFLNQEGRLTEASTSNLFVARAGAIHTPPLREGLLAGITRQLVIDACAADGLAVRETELAADDLTAADEIFLTSTLRDVAPVVALDNRPVGAGEPGPLTVRVAALFEADAARRCREVYGPAYAQL